MKQSPMLYVLRVLQNPASEDINLNGVQVYGTLIWKISPLALWTAEIGQYNNEIIDVS